MRVVEREPVRRKYMQEEETSCDRTLLHALSLSNGGTHRFGNAIARAQRVYGVNIWHVSERWTGYFSSHLCAFSSKLDISRCLPGGTGFHFSALHVYRDNWLIVRKGEITQKNFWKNSRAQRDRIVLPVPNVPHDWSWQEKVSLSDKKLWPSRVLCSIQLYTTYTLHSSFQFVANHKQPQTKASECNKQQGTVFTF